MKDLDTHERNDIYRKIKQSTEVKFPQAFVQLQNAEEC